MGKDHIWDSTQCERETNNTGNFPGIFPGNFPPWDFPWEFLSLGFSLGFPFSLVISLGFSLVISLGFSLGFSLGISLGFSPGKDHIQAKPDPKTIYGIQHSWDPKTIYGIETGLKDHIWDSTQWDRETGPKDHRIQLSWDRETRPKDHIWETGLKDHMGFNIVGTGKPDPNTIYGIQHIWDRESGPKDHRIHHSLVLPLHCAGEGERALSLPRATKRRDQTRFNTVGTGKPGQRPYMGFNTVETGKLDPKTIGFNTVTNCVESYGLWVQFPCPNCVESHIWSLCPPTVLKLMFLSDEFCYRTLF